MILLKTILLFAASLNFDILEKISAQRSFLSPLPKITIEEAYYRLGKEITPFLKKNSLSNFDEIACFKFHKQLFRSEKIIGTIGRHSGKIYNTKEDKKSFEIIKAWKKNVEKQTFGFYPYTHNDKSKLSYVYDFGEDEGNFKHICVIKLFAEKIKKTTPFPLKSLPRG